ncbi:MAG: hypothetical protein RMJ67_08925, partial [Elusimicrobiota bacterium]|nr:hypothetical protein [Endomicrobiia bacterium]MDW8166619.1 hypothetical protein [Elusimicrobiota bacterium]
MQINWKIIAPIIIGGSVLGLVLLVKRKGSEETTSQQLLYIPPTLGVSSTPIGDISDLQDFINKSNLQYMQEQPSTQLPTQPSTPPSQPPQPPQYRDIPHVQFETPAQTKTQEQIIESLRPGAIVDTSKFSLSQTIEQKKEDITFQNIKEKINKPLEEELKKSNLPSLSQIQSLTQSSLQQQIDKPSVSIALPAKEDIKTLSFSQIQSLTQSSLSQKTEVEHSRSEKKPSEPPKPSISIALPAKEDIKTPSLSQIQSLTQSSLQQQIDKPSITPSPKFGLSIQISPKDLIDKGKENIPKTTEKPGEKKEEPKSIPKSLEYQEKRGPSAIEQVQAQSKPLETKISQNIPKSLEYQEKRESSAIGQIQVQQKPSEIKKE